MVAGFNPILPSEVFFREMDCQLFHSCSCIITFIELAAKRRQNTCNARILSHVGVFVDVSIIIWPRRDKTCLRGFANNTGVDKPAHPRSLISAFLIRFSESIIYKLATGKISIF